MSILSTGLSDHEKPLSCTVKRTSKLTGLGESTIWLYLKEGRLEGRNVGRRRLVLYSSIERLLGIDKAAA